MYKSAENTMNWDNTVEEVPTSTLILSHTMEDISSQGGRLVISLMYTASNSKFFRTPIPFERFRSMSSGVSVFVNLFIE